MNCEEGRPLLEEYFDGELAAAEAARVAAHLSACAPCAALYESLGREQEFYLRAEPQAATPATLWAGVSARLEEERGGGRLARLWRDVRGRSALAAFGAPRFSPALTAAAVLAAVALTAGVMKYFDAGRQTPQGPSSVARRESGADDSRPGAGVEASAPAGSGGVESDTAARSANTGERGDGAGRAPARREAGGAASKTEAAVSKTEVAAVGERRRVGSSPPVEGGVGARSRDAEARRGDLADARRGDTPDELVRDAERKYVAAIALLARDVRRRRSALEAGEAARFERTLAAVDRAIAETRRAARRRPADPLAAQYMLAAYSKKVDLLRDMASH
jgi:hypothetical protein